MRLFLALELSDGLRGHLSRLQSLLAPGLSSASPTRPENLHMTLKFLGEVPDGNLPALCAALGQLPPLPPLRLSLGVAECFPNRGRVRIIGVSLVGDLEPLLQLQSAIDAACHACGHPLESRRFRPHVTVARARTPLPPTVRFKVDRAIEQLGASPGMQATEFILMQSHLSPRGTRYEPAARFALSGKST